MHVSKKPQKLDYCDEGSGSVKNAPNDMVSFFIALPVTAFAMDTVWVFFDLRYAERRRRERSSGE